MDTTEVPRQKRLTRFFVAPDQINGDTVRFSGDDAHHMFIVLKMRIGQTCIALDDTGRSLLVELDEIGRSDAAGHIVRIDHPQTEARVKITVAQALPKTLDKLEWVLEHGAEIGVHQFVIFSCERARENADRFRRKLDRWKEIVKTAAEQSERTRLPQVTGIPAFTELLAGAANHETALMAYEREERVTLRQALSPSARDVLIIVGPEGGFTDEEVVLARQAGVGTVSLGPRILRTETAALVMASQCLYALEPETPELTVITPERAPRTGAAASW